MIELVVFNFLKNKIGVPCYMEVPVKKANEFLLIEKVGGHWDNHLGTSTFAIETVSTSLFKTCELKEKLRSKLPHILELDKIAGFDIVNEANNTDSDDKKYSYLTVIEIKHY